MHGMWHGVTQIWIELTWWQNSTKIEETKNNITNSQFFHIYCKHLACERGQIYAAPWIFVYPVTQEVIVKRTMLLLAPLALMDSLPIVLGAPTVRNAWKVRNWVQILLLLIFCTYHVTKLFNHQEPFSHWVIILKTM